MSAESCYQEQANESTACGGLNTGTYQIVNGTGSFIGNGINITDGNLSTSDFIPSSDIGNVTVYINYSKPSNYTSLSRWYVKDSESGTDNLTINDCLDQSPLQFAIVAIRGISSSGGTNYKCYDGSSWNTLQSSGAGFYTSIFEEGMYWDIDFSPSIDESEISPSSGVYTNDDLLGYCNASDPNIVGVQGFNYIWYNHTTTFSSGSINYTSISSSPFNGSNNDSVGTTSWTNPNNILLDDFSYASNQAGKSQGDWDDEEVYLVYNDILIGSNKADTPINSWINNSDTFITYGDFSDNWDYDLTPDIVNDESFGVAIRFKSANGIEGQYLIATNFSNNIANDQSILGVEAIYKGYVDEEFENSNSYINSVQLNITTGYSNESKPNVANVTSSNTLKDEDWIFSCRAYDGTTYSAWINSTNATILNTAPVKVSVTIPLNETTINDTTPNIQLSSCSDIDTGDSCDNYTIIISNTSDFSNTFLNESTNLTNYNITTTLDDLTTYYLRVRSNDGSNFSLWSDSITFSVDSTVASIEWDNTSGWLTSGTSDQTFTNNFLINNPSSANVTFCNASIKKDGGTGNLQTFFSVNNSNFLLQALSSVDLSVNITNPTAATYNNEYLHVFCAVEEDTTQIISTSPGIELTFTVSNPSSPPITPSGGGGGGGSDAPSKKDCNITLNQEALSFSIFTDVLPLELTNFEDFSITPKYEISDMQYVSLKGLVNNKIIPLQTSSLSLVKSENIPDNISGISLTISSDECNDIEIPIDLEPTISKSFTLYQGSIGETVAFLIDGTINFFTEDIGSGIATWHILILSSVIAFFSFIFIPAQQITTGTRISAIMFLSLILTVILRGLVQIIG